ncbi:hypothetical protein GQ53DRAFT_442844 [Thozetella sp. PMI_491]|nr:hypothetical protein GQ53DRAFT_442844 [Thozetella sp. PMI_491]
MHEPSACVCHVRGFSCPHTGLILPFVLTTIPISRQAVRADAPPLPVAEPMERCQRNPSVSQISATKTTLITFLSFIVSYFLGYLSCSLVPQTIRHNGAGGRSTNRFCVECPGRYNPLAVEEDQAPSLRYAVRDDGDSESGSAGMIAIAKTTHWHSGHRMRIV